MFWRLGYTALLVSVTGQGDLGDLSGYTTIFMQFLLAILNIAYVSLDFKLSDRAVDSFHVVKDWRLSDRDFGLTLSADGLYTLVASDGNLKALTPQYIQSKMMDIVSKGFQRARVGHLRLGVVIDLISLMIASILFTSAAMRLLKWKPCTIAFPVRASVDLSFPGPQLTLVETILHCCIRTSPLRNVPIYHNDTLRTSQLEYRHQCRQMECMDENLPTSRCRQRHFPCE